MSTAPEGGFLSRRLADVLARRRAGAPGEGAPRAAGRAPSAAGRRGLPRPRRRAVLIAVAALALLLAAWFWFRDSSLVEVKTVEVSGVNGAPGTQGGRVRAALDEAARSMTTLHVRRDALETAVEPFALVKRIEVATDFPNTMRIHVVTNVAVGVVLVDGQRIAVTSDGTLLRGVTASARLPQIPVRAAPAGNRLTEPAAQTAVEALGAAPPELRGRVEGIVTTPEHGLEIRLAHGPVLWFGAGDRLAAKWVAATAVLADAEAAGAASINVSAPERPAVGGLPDGAPAQGESDVPVLPDGTVETDPGLEVEPAPDPGSTLDPQ